MKRAGALAALALAIGCATSNVVTAADGKPAYRVECGRNAQQCSRKADRACGDLDYQVLDDGVRMGTIVTPNGHRIPNERLFQGFIVFRCGR